MLEMTGGPSELSTGEAKRLDELEEAIAACEKRHLQIGLLLRSVRDERLYRKSHGNFESYCRDRWGKPRQSVNRAIRATEVVEEMKADGFAVAIVRAPSAGSRSPQ